MKTLTTILITALAGTLLSVSAPAAFAHDHGRDWGERGEWHHDNGRHHGHYNHYREYGYYAPPAVVYQPYYAPPPPRVVYQPAYPVYREPAITIGVGIPPIVIPLR